MMKQEKNNQKNSHIERDEVNKFLQLPEEVLLNIIGFFNKRDLARTALTCKQLNKITKNPHLQKLPWPSLHYGLPTVQHKKVISYKQGLLGVLKADLFAGRHKVIFELLPQSYLAALLIINSDSSSPVLKLQFLDLKTEQMKSSSIQISQETHQRSVKFFGLSEEHLAIAEINLGDNRDSIIGVWDIRLERCLKQMTVLGVIHSLVKVSPSCLVSATETTLQWWDQTSGECLKTLDNCGIKISHLLVVLDKGWLISADRERRAANTIKVWHSQTGELIKAFSDLPVMSLLWLPPNLLAGITDNNCIKLWDIDTTECIRTFEELSEVKSQEYFRLNELIALSNDYLVSGGSDNSIVIWDIKQGKCIQRLGSTTLAVNSFREIAYPRRLPNGDLVAYYSSGDYERSIQIWKFPELNSEDTLEKNSDSCCLQ